ncbi:hypothetical protein HanRHA438_Chr06g0280801 [Helianthus annuus]|uniref:SOSEKI DIX-like domain-containing protein n=1 Tax=Helianthus annuus TaxID=4232 RepID=A0A251RMG5_HELAN|nr:hypothetical protein HanXRQr2_Chr06g0271821 [Helianthus annuus]KAJ0561422.1 putative protein SOSEKI [Helianthus annuus]KAJ0568062.1 hypothetical protein HanIR_Chr06g0291861 [Helianthus annuus]KAJ0574480.1 putative protein SOSEKI [Helianthus annuus]KAJ0738814.1 putative protein SOSEKI [Helianthus annuus]
MKQFLKDGATDWDAVIDADHMEATGLYFVRCSMKCLCERSPGNQQRRPEPVQEMEPEWQQKSRKDDVVYFLCKDRQLEPAHFIEVALASLEGLFLRDVIEKLNVLRGNGMASM